MQNGKKVEQKGKVTLRKAAMGYFVWECPGHIVSKNEDKPKASICNAKV